jgi:hypothetical protein
MDELQKFLQRNLRRIVAVAALLLSLAAITALTNSTPKGSLWAVKSEIAAGSKITAASVGLVKAEIASSTHHYQSNIDQVIGRYATRSLQSGDLISASDLSTQAPNASSSFLPIGVATNDLPLDLAVGDHVDIYVIPKDVTVLPAIVARRVVIQNIDQKSRSLGGNIGVSVIANSAISNLIVSAEAEGRLVLARDSF